MEGYFYNEIKKNFFFSLHYQWYKKWTIYILIIAFEYINIFSIEMYYLYIWINKQHILIYVNSIFYYI